MRTAKDLVYLWSRKKCKNTWKFLSIRISLFFIGRSDEISKNDQGHSRWFQQFEKIVEVDKEIMIWILWFIDQYRFFWIKNLLSAKIWYTPLTMMTKHSIRVIVTILSPLWRLKSTNLSSSYLYFFWFWIVFTFI